MPFEVVVVRRDGFDGEIELVMENLPDGVTAAGLRIPAGSSRGILLITADQNAPRGMSVATVSGRAVIDGTTITRPCQMASMAWPVTNAWSEIPSPRLLADLPVSVCGSEFAPLTIAAADEKVWEVTEGEKLTIPLITTRRCEFSGTTMKLKTLGAGFDKRPAFDAPLNADTCEAVLDLAALKTPPGNYLIAFYGSAVAKYRYHPESVTEAEAALAAARQRVAESAAEAESLTAVAATVPEEEKTAAAAAAQEAIRKQKAAEAAVAAAEKQLKAATAAAAPKDIVDIVVSTPIAINVRPVPKADSK